MGNCVNFIDRIMSDNEAKSASKDRGLILSLAAPYYANVDLNDVYADPVTVIHVESPPVYAQPVYAQPVYPAVRIIRANVDEYDKDDDLKDWRETETPWYSIDSEAGLIFVIGVLVLLSICIWTQLVKDLDQQEFYEDGNARGQQTTRRRRI